MGLVLRLSLCLRRRHLLSCGSELSHAGCRREAFHRRVLQEATVEGCSSASATVSSLYFCGFSSLHLRLFTPSTAGHCLQNVGFHWYRKHTLLSCKCFSFLAERDAFWAITLKKVKWSCRFSSVLAPEVCHLQLPCLAASLEHVGFLKLNEIESKLRFCVYNFWNMQIARSVLVIYFLVMLTLGLQPSGSVRLFPSS